MEGEFSGGKYSNDLWASQVDTPTQGNSAWTQNQQGNAFMTQQQSSLSNQNRQSMIQNHTRATTNNIQQTMVDPHALMGDTRNVPLDRQGYMANSAPLYTDVPRVKNGTASKTTLGPGPVGTGVPPGIPSSMPIQPSSNPQYAHLQQINQNAQNRGMLVGGGAAVGHVESNVKTDMSKVTPAEFRKYILYVQTTRKPMIVSYIDQNGMEQEKTEILPVCPNSIKSIEMIRDFEQEVWVEEIKDIKKQDRAPWMDGSPILLSLDTKRAFKGSQCLAQLYELSRAPKGVSCADDGLSCSLEGDTISAIDSWDVGTSQMKKYCAQGTVSSNDAEYYINARQNKDKLLSQKKPSMAQMKAIQESIKMTYQ